ncbi:MAG: hypothetical protein TREMPRED_004991 [Tremellales sp. Tagirdzhanova-0007]|nr:MAG: hypothetical protein TREMPRED_004991 [Tremellales sp. Tagirdzhanova-0007]
MDIVLRLADDHFLDRAYAYLLPYPAVPPVLFNDNTTSLPLAYSSSTTYHPNIQPISLLPRDSIIRQTVSCFTVALIGALILYYVVCSLSYYFLFDRRLEHHPRYIKDQVRLEIKASMIAAPWIDFLMLPWFVAEVRGKSKLYDRVDEYGWPFLVASAVMFLHIHKPHHKWIMPTPWAALAFHPLDGYAQSLPYHIFTFVIPMHKYLFLTLFIFVQIWTILIHDGDMISGHMLERYINSPAHHTLHHLYFTCNYGQYFTWADSCFDSYRPPEPELDPLHEALRMMRKKGLIDEASNPITPRRVE